MSEGVSDHFRDPAAKPRLTKRSTVRSDRCRCGTRLVPGAEHWIIENTPASLTPLIDGTTFCSLRCTRAFLLESMETLDSLDRANAETLVSDLRETYLLLSVILSQAAQAAVPPSER